MGLKVSHEPGHHPAERDHPKGLAEPNAIIGTRLIQSVSLCMFLGDSFICFFSWFSCSLDFLGDSLLFLVFPHVYPIRSTHRTFLLPFISIHLALQELEQQLDLRGVPRHRFLRRAESGTKSTVEPSYGAVGVGSLWKSLCFG